MKIVKIKDISTFEIFKLVHYLEKFASTKEEQKQFVLSHYKNFFPKLSFEQEVILENIIDTEDEPALEKFINAYPDIEVNLDGDSIIPANNDNGIQAKEKALIMSYEYLSKSDKKLTSKEKQILRAFELTCLKNIAVNEKDYTILKFKTIQKEKSEQLQNIKKYEEIPDFNTKIFLSKVFQYYLHTGASTFLKYVFYYLDIVRLNPESELRKIYLENIKKIIK